MSLKSQQFEITQAVNALLCRQLLINDDMIASQSVNDMFSSRDYITSTSSDEISLIIG